MRARSVKFVPRPALVLLGGALLCQLVWHGSRPAPEARAEDLPRPPSLHVLRVASAGDSLAMSKLLMLWLQAFDNQPGVSVPFSRLDYAAVTGWLGRILELDPRGQYPLLFASRVYSNVPSPEKKRAMFEFVHERFLEDPDRRWPWLAYAAIDTKHHLKDLQTALRYTKAITEHATGDDVPAWARDMSVLVLEELGEYESAVFLAHHLLESGRVSDPNEVRHLAEKLESLKRLKEAAAQASPKP